MWGTGREAQVGVSEVLKGTVPLPQTHDNPPTCACGGPDSRGGSGCLGAIWGPERKCLVVIKGARRKDEPSCSAPPRSHPLLNPQGSNPTHVS